MKVKGIKKGYKNLQVLEDISFELDNNKIGVILGPSGCGKTTLFRILSGLTKADEGHIVDSDFQNMSYVFQDLRLLPWKNVYDNMAFVLKGKIPKEELDDTINEYLEYVGLEDYKKYRINELSGGMQQKLCLARAFAYPSKIMLMDEPFKSLDYEGVQQIMGTFKELWLQHKKTVLFITHDLRYGVHLGHQLYLLKDKPTSIIKEYTNKIPLMERQFNDANSIALEKKIYEDLMRG